MGAWFRDVLKAVRSLARVVQRLVENNLFKRPCAVDLTFLRLVRVFGILLVAVPGVFNFKVGGLEVRRTWVEEVRKIGSRNNKVRSAYPAYPILGAMLVPFIHFVTFLYINPPKQCTPSIATPSRVPCVLVQTFSPEGDALQCYFYFQTFIVFNAFST